MKYCEEYAALISAGVDDALTADERRILMEHLAACPACREAYTQMLTMHEGFSSMDAELPGDLAGDVMKAVRAQRGAKRSRRRTWMPLVAAAACCALVLLGSLDLLPGSNVADDAATTTFDSAERAAAPEGDAVAAANTAAADRSVTDEAADDLITYTASAEDILSGESEEQLLSGVLTFFSGAPEEALPAGSDEADAAAEDEPMLRIITSVESALPEWMAEHTDGTPVEDEDGTLAWLITSGECALLTEWLESEALLWEQYQLELSEETEEDMVCVVYLPS